jgi:hypothetical protein
MVMLIPYGHSLGYIHHTGLLHELNQYQSHQSLQYFTKVLDDVDRNIICGHLLPYRPNVNSKNRFQNLFENLFL